MRKLQVLNNRSVLFCLRTWAGDYLISNRALRSLSLEGVVLLSDPLVLWLRSLKVECGWRPAGGLAYFPNWWLNTVKLPNNGPSNWRISLDYGLIPNPRLENFIGWISTSIFYIKDFLYGGLLWKFSWPWEFPWSLWCGSLTVRGIRNRFTPTPTKRRPIHETPLLRVHYVACLYTMAHYTHCYAHNACTHVNMHTFFNVYMLTCLHTHMLTCSHAHMLTCLHTYIHTYCILLTTNWWMKYFSAKWNIFLSAFRKNNSI